MDAQEIERERGDHQKLRHALLVNGISIVQAERRDGQLISRVAFLPCSGIAGEAAPSEGVQSPDERRCDGHHALPQEIQSSA